jgi:putative transposase
MLKTYRYEIYPTKEQINELSCWFGSVRWVYNWGLEQKIKSYNENKKTLSYFDLSMKLTELKKQEEYKWLDNTYSQSLNMSLRNLDNAFTAFFKQQNKFPKFKSKKNTRKSVQFPQGVKMDFDNWNVFIPKLKNIKVAKDRKFIGNIKTCTLSKSSTNRYFISVLVDNGVKQPKQQKIKEDKTIGIDLGIKTFATLSNGVKFNNSKFLKKQEIKLVVHQKRLSKKQKGSKNYEQQKLKIAKIHEKISNQRKDFQHKVSSQIAYDNQVNTICMETLSTKNMMKNHKLAGSIGDCGWFQFSEMCRYKMEWQGKNFVKIGKFEPSSKTCTCGYKNNNLSLDQREWTCIICGTKHDRDILAANNIRTFGLETARRLGQDFVGKQSSLEELNKSSVKRHEGSSDLRKRKEPPTL